MLFAFSVPWLGRALARRGDPRAGDLLSAAWERAQRQRLLLGVAYAGPGVRRVGVACRAAGGRRRVGRLAAPRLAHPGGAPFRAELLRFLARAGLPAEPFDGCPEPWAAASAATAGGRRGWAQAGDPFEKALELTATGAARPSRKACGRSTRWAPTAPPPASVRELRAAGMPRPRGPRATTRANPRASRSASSRSSSCSAMG